MYFGNFGNDMNIVVIGKTDNTLYRHEVWYAKQLSTMGHTVYFADIRTCSDRLIDEMLAPTLPTQKIDLVLIFGGSNLEAFPIEKLRKENILVYLWHHDWHPEGTPVWLLDICARCDRVLWTIGEDSDMLDVHGQLPVWVPTVPHADIFHPTDYPLSKKKERVLFMGTPHTDRVAKIRGLLDKGIKIDIYGGHNITFPWPTDLQDMVKPLQVGAAANELLNQYAIVLNLGCTQHVQYAFSDRFLMTAAAGAFGVNEYFKGIEDIMNDGVHCAIWRNIDECVNAIIYYLDFPNERQKVAQHGYENFLKFFTIDTSCQRILELVNENQPPK